MVVAVEDAGLLDSRLVSRTTTIVQGAIDFKRDHWGRVHNHVTVKF